MRILVPGIITRAVTSQKKSHDPVSGHIHTIHENNNDAFRNRPDA